MAYNKRSRNVRTIISRTQAANTYPKKLEDRLSKVSDIIIEHRKNGKFWGEHWANEECELCDQSKKKL